MSAFNTQKMLKPASGPDGGVEPLKTPCPFDRCVPSLASASTRVPCFLSNIAPSPTTSKKASLDKVRRSRPPKSPLMSKRRTRQPSSLQIWTGTRYDSCNLFYGRLPDRLPRYPSTRSIPDYLHPHSKACPTGKFSNA